MSPRIVASKKHRAFLLTNQSMKRNPFRIQKDMSLAAIHLAVLNFHDPNYLFFVVEPAKHSHCPSPNFFKYIDWQIALEPTNVTHHHFNWTTTSISSYDTVTSPQPPPPRFHSQQPIAAISKGIRLPSGMCSASRPAVGSPRLPTCIITWFFLLGRFFFLGIQNPNESSLKIWKYQSHIEKCRHLEGPKVTLSIWSSEALRKRTAGTSKKDHKMKRIFFTEQKPSDCRVPSRIFLRTGHPFLSLSTRTYSNKRPWKKLRNQRFVRRSSSRNWLNCKNLCQMFCTTITRHEPNLIPEKHINHRSMYILNKRVLTSEISMWFQRQKRKRPKKELSPIPIPIQFVTFSHLLFALMEQLHSRTALHLLLGFAGFPKVLWSNLWNLHWVFPPKWLNTFEDPRWSKCVDFGWGPKKWTHCHWPTSEIYDKWLSLPCRSWKKKTWCFCPQSLWTGKP